MKNQVVSRVKEQIQESVLGLFFGNEGTGKGRDAYNLGFDSVLRGKTMEANPYWKDMEPKEWEGWNSGYAEGLFGLAV